MLFFPRIPDSFSAWDGQGSINEQLFNILLNTYCIMYIPRSYLLHTFQSMLQRQNNSFPHKGFSTAFIALTASQTVINIFPQDSWGVRQYYPPFTDEELRQSEFKVND